MSPQRHTHRTPGTPRGGGGGGRSPTRTFAVCGRVGGGVAVALSLTGPRASPAAAYAIGNSLTPGSGSAACTGERAEHQAGAPSQGCCHPLPGAVPRASTCSQCLGSAAGISPMHKAPHEEGTEGQQPASAEGQPQGLQHCRKGAVPFFQHPVPLRCAPWGTSREKGSKYHP